MLPSTSARSPRAAGLFIASAFALTLAACGGGGGGAGFVGSTPPPPPPTPTPTPTPTFSISAPGRATTNSGVPRILASASGPNFTKGPAAGTVFPLLQTTLTINETSIQPDAAVNVAGGTATVTASGLSIDVLDLHGVTPEIDAVLDWTRAGRWAFDESPWDYSGFPSQRSVFVLGYETPAASMPTTGSATFTGSATGLMYYPSGPDALPCNCQELTVQGDAAFTANFGARTLTGGLTNMTRVWWDEGAWNDVSFSATIAGNGFSGTTRVTTAPALGMGANATGTLEGKFFGPSANEAGAVWTLFDGTNAAIGTLSGKRP